MFRKSLFVVVLLLVVFAVGCQTAEPEVVEVPVEVEVTRIVEVPVEAEPAAAAPGLSPMMPVEFDTFNSSIMGREYALTVALPMSYGMTEVDYPVIVVRLLETNVSLGDPEAFYDFSAGFEDLALLSATDTAFIDNYAAGREEATPRGSQRLNNVSRPEPCGLFKVTDCRLPLTRTRIRPRTLYSML